jgi:hypothetical protein
MSLLPLPSITPSGSHLARSPDVTRALDTLRQLYFTATSILKSGGFQRQRLRAHQDLLLQTRFPLLATLEEVAETESIPTEWLYDTAGKFSALLLELLEAERAVDGMCVPSLFPTT